MKNDRPFEIPLSGPDISQLEIDHVLEVLRSGRLSIGSFTEQFESRVADLTGRDHAIAVSSGTAGLHLALLALGIGRGDEVITSPFTFIAPANSILYVGARPIFVDIHPTSLNMDPNRIEAAITPRTKAIIAIENFGNPMHMHEICEIARTHGIPVIEDACEGFGSSCRDQPVGSFGRLAVFGFYPNKPITTGEGGMIVTDDPHLAALCRSMRNQGRRVLPADSPPVTDGERETSPTNLGGWLQHDRLGYNYRMSELHAALGVAQMRRLDEIIERRNTVASRYFQCLADHADITLPTIDPETKMSWFVFVVLLSSHFSEEDRNEIINGFRRHEIGVNHYFPPIHLQPFYRTRFGYHEGMYPICERIAKRTIALPFFNHLTDREVDLVCQTLDVMIQRTRFSRGGDERE